MLTEEQIEELVTMYWPNDPRKYEQPLIYSHALTAHELKLFDIAYCERVERAQNSNQLR
jgi:hypothetical protein